MSEDELLTAITELQLKSALSNRLTEHKLKYLMDHPEKLEDTIKFFQGHAYFLWSLEALRDEGKRAIAEEGAQ